LNKLKALEISGDFMPDQRIIIPDIEPSWVGPDEVFFPQNLERLVFAPNLLSTIDAKFKNPYGSKWWSLSAEYDWRHWILPCFGHVLRRIHIYRPELKTVGISADVFAPEFASNLRFWMKCKGVELTIQT
jgi:hypothetical protein